jgi:hypothetical protein
MESVSATESAARFFIYGFHAVLRRYRAMTLLGWAAVAWGGATVVLGWNYGQPHGVFDLMLSLAAVLAGVALVQQSVAALSSYVQIPYPMPPGAQETVSGIFTKCAELMKEVDAGGWQDAYNALTRIRQLEAEYLSTEGDHHGEATAGIQ